MSKNFKFFKTAFSNLIDKILVIEQKDQMIKNVYSLIAKFFQELHKAQAQLNPNDLNSFMNSIVSHLMQTYFLQKCPQQVQLRAAFLLSEISMNFGISRIQKLDQETKMKLLDLVRDLFHQTRTNMMLYGVQIAAEICNQNNQSDQMYIELMKMMTHSTSREVRRTCIDRIKAPFSQITLLLLGKRLRDKDDDIRRQAYTKLTKSKVTIEHFPSQEQRMLIIKEGLTDQNPNVREACIEFLKSSIIEQEGEVAKMKGDLSYLFKIIDCKQMFIKEYYIQLPFIIIRLIFHLAGENDLIVAKYLEQITLKLKVRSNLIVSDNNMSEGIKFEEILFLRICYEFIRIYKVDRSSQFMDLIDQISISFEDYSQIFNTLLIDSQITTEDRVNSRLLFSEWVKFSLQLPIEDEVTRRNLVSLMFQFVGHVYNSYHDYQHLLRYKRFLIKEQDLKSLEMAMEDDQGAAELEYDQLDNQDDQVIEIEIREFRDLSMQKRDIQEYCKPFSFESLVLDSDDVCRIAVIVARKLLEARIDEFSLSMLQAISDIKEPIDELAVYDDNEQETLTFKKQREIVFRKMEQKLEQVNEIVAQEDYDLGLLNQVMRKVKHYVALIEELNLKEKLNFKRALNLCLILLKQCRADVNDQNLIQICETLIGPTIQSKDKDNMLLAIECIGLLCLLDKELFQNYSRIFQTILTEDITSEETNLREKIIALKSSVDSLIIHGVDAKTTLKLQRIIIEDYMVIKDRILRQITIEGICKMLFSRKLTQDADHNEVEFLLSQLIIQWFDHRFNWQNSLVRQLLSVFFKSFVLFSQQRCDLMTTSLTKVIYSILESKYGCGGVSANKKQKKPDSNEKKKKEPKKKGRRGQEDSSDDDEYDVNQDQSYVSDDSRCAENQASMHKICANLDAIQITKVFMVLLSKDYVNSNAAKEFQLKKDLQIEFLLNVACINATKIKKVAIVKDYISSIVEHVNITNCDDMVQLRLLQKYMEQNSKMLIQPLPKLKKFAETLDRRIDLLTKNQDSLITNNQVDELLNSSVAQPALSEKDRDDLLIAFMDKLASYYDDEILGTLVDLVHDNDEDEFYMQLHKNQTLGLGQLIISPRTNKSRLTQQAGSSEDEQFDQRSSMNLRRRRSGLRSNKKRLMNTMQENFDSRHLKSIPEVKEDFIGIKDISSSEKVPKFHAKLLNDTILEERESPFNYQEDSQSSSINNINPAQNDKVMRERAMAKISKRMAKDFAENKKKSLSISSFNQQQSFIQSSVPVMSQMQEAGNASCKREEYLDKTVYKITKGRSPQRQALNDESFVNSDANNLSIQFDQVNELPSSNQKKGKNNEVPQKPVIEPVTVLLQPKIAAPLPRMTRSQMKEQNSNNSRKMESSSEEEESSEDNTFDFFKSNLSKKVLPAKINPKSANQSNDNSFNKNQKNVPQTKSNNSSFNQGKGQVPTYQNMRVTRGASRSRK